MEPAPRIDTVRPMGPTRLLIRFRNGEEKTYDCGALLSRPEFSLLSVPAFFRAVRVDAGGYGISWNDDIDLSEYELWTNGEPITSGERPAAVADAGVSPAGDRFAVHEG